MKVIPIVQKLIDNEDFDTLQQIAGGSSNGFWYDLTDGGYFDYKKVLAEKADIERVEAAIKTLRELESVYTNVCPEF